MRCLRLPAVVGCFVSTFILLSQLLLFASQYYRCYFLCLFLLFFFLSHAVCCPSCLCRLSSAAVTCFVSTLPLLLSISRCLLSKLSVSSQFSPAVVGYFLDYLFYSSFSCVLCFRVSVLPLLLLALPQLFLLFFSLAVVFWLSARLTSSAVVGFPTFFFSRSELPAVACRPDFSFSTSSSLVAICVRLFCPLMRLLCLVSSSNTLSSLSCAVSIFQYPLLLASLDSATSSFFSCAPALLDVACYVSLHFLFSLSQLFSS